MFLRILGFPEIQRKVSVKKKGLRRVLHGAEAPWRNILFLRKTQMSWTRALLGNSGLPRMPRKSLPEIRFCSGAGEGGQQPRGATHAFIRETN